MPYVTAVMTANVDQIRTPSQALHYVFYIHYILNLHKNLRSIDHFYSHFANEETKTKVGHVVQDHRTYIWYSWNLNCGL